MEAQIEQILNTRRRPNETWRDVFNRLETSGRVDMKALVDLTALMLEALEKLRLDLEDLNEDRKILLERTKPHEAGKLPTPKPKAKAKK